MKKNVLLGTIILSLISQTHTGSFADLDTTSSAPVNPWSRVSGQTNEKRQAVFDTLQANRNYTELAKLKERLSILDQQYGEAFRERIRTQDYNTFKAKKAELDQQEQALLDAALEIVPAYDNPPAYEEPRLPDYSAGNWDELPTYEEEDWSDETGWVKVDDRDLAGFYDSSEYEQSLQQEEEDNSSDSEEDSDDSSDEE